MRKKPPGVLLPSAHAVDREYKVITALSQTDVPAAKTYALCEDDSVIGHMFYIMEHVEGRVFRDFSIPGVTPAERFVYWDVMGETMAKLHNVNFRAVGLEGYGRVGGRSSAGPASTRPARPMSWWKWTTSSSGSTKTCRSMTRPPLSTAISAWRT